MGPPSMLSPYDDCCRDRARVVAALGPVERASGFGRMATAELALGTAGLVAARGVMCGSSGRDQGQLPSTTERLLPWTSSVSQAKKLTMYSLSSPKQGAGRSGKVESTVDSRESVRHSGQACPEHPTTLQEPARGLSTCRGLRFRTDWGLDEADPNNDRCREIDSSHSLQSSGNRSRFLGADLGFPGVFWADAFGGEIAADSLIGPPSRAVSRRRRFFPPGVRISLPIRS